MNQNNIKEIVSDWNAYVCAIPGAAMPTWSKFLNDIPDDDYNLLHDAVTVIGDRMAEGRYSKNPNLGQLQKEYKSQKIIRDGKNRRNHPDCSICFGTGLLSMVIAYDNSKSRQVPLKYQIAVPSDRADVVSTPCSCETGKEVAGPSFVNPGSQKGDEDRNYTSKQIESLAVNCGYSSVAEAEVYRDKCERFAKAWREKYPKKKLDQTIGYKGPENKQVAGFFVEDDRRYNPSEY